MLDYKRRIRYMEIGKQFKHILVAVDDSYLGQMALVNAIHQAREDEAKLTIVSIFEKGQLSVFDFFSKEKTTAAEDDVRRALDRYRKMALENGLTDVDIRIAEGEPGEVIVKDVIPAVQPDMVIIGSNSQKGTEKYFGSQSSYIANHAPVTVMIVR